MKNLLKTIGITALTLALLAGCAQNSDSGSQTDTDPAPQENVDAATPDITENEEDEAPVGDLIPIVVGATPAPHAEILEAVRDILADEGYDLVIREFTDYVQPNNALDSGDLDANYFQHQPYLDDFIEENGVALTSIADIHYEPLGIFPGKTASLEELADGAQVAVPNDTTNEARALLLLQDQGLITLNEDAGLSATINDIIDNPKNLDIVEIEAAQLPRSLQDVDIAVINGNYAIDAGLNASTDALAKEESDSLAAQTFANVIAVRIGDEDRAELQALVAALTSDECKAFIDTRYEGAVVPIF